MYEEPFSGLKNLSITLKNLTDVHNDSRMDNDGKKDIESLIGAIIVSMKNMMVPSK